MSAHVSGVTNKKKIIWQTHLIKMPKKNTFFDDAIAGIKPLNLKSKPRRTLLDTYMRNPPLSTYKPPATTGSSVRIDKILDSTTGINKDPMKAARSVSLVPKNQKDVPYRETTGPRITPTNAEIKKGLRNVINYTAYGEEKGKKVTAYQEFVDTQAAQYASDLKSGKGIGTGVIGMGQNIVTEQKSLGLKNSDIYTKKEMNAQKENQDRIDRENRGMERRAKIKETVLELPGEIAKGTGKFLGSAFSGISEGLGFNPGIILAGGAAVAALVVLK